MSSLSLLKDLITPDVERVFLSSYCIDEDWFFSLLPPNIPVCIACPRPQGIQTSQIVCKNRAYVFPPMAFPYGVMHIKLLLLWYPTFLRIVLPSANAVPYDWGLIENTVWYQDFPRTETTRNKEYFSELKFVLGSMGVPPSVLQRLEGYDASLALGRWVYSIPGWHTRAMGLDLLRNHVRDMGVCLENAVVTAQSSSMGMLSSSWCTEFMTHCGGSRLELVFPTHATVLRAMTRVGPGTGGTIHAKRGYWERPAFQRHVLYDCEARSGGLLHSKLILVASERQESITVHTTEPVGYLYCGSHNATSSAWGILQKGKRKIMNWELGIVLPFAWGDAFSIPFVYPPRAYTPQDHPWFQTEYND
jgi:tyrosyl-DNA phosphodiesterase-1